MISRRRSPETKLRYARAEIRALREEVKASREVGMKMRNFCMSLANFHPGCRTILGDWCRQWDAIKRVPEGK